MSIPADSNQSSVSGEPSRRGFLKTAGAIAVGLSAAANVSAGDKPSGPPARKFRICLTPGMINVKANIKDSIALATQFGFEAIDPAVSELASMSSDALAQLREEMKAKNLAWGALGMGMPMTQSDDSFKSFLAKLPGTAAVLQHAGANRMATWINPGDNRLTYQEQFKRLSDRVKEIATILDDHGIRFGLEYLGPKTMRVRSRYPFIHIMYQMRELIADTGKRNVGLLLDSWHWYNAQDTPAEIGQLKSDDVIWIHLNDAPANVPLDKQVDSRRALPATTGVIDIGGFLGALIHIGYDGPASAEPFDNSLGRLPREEAVKRTREAIGKALEKVST